MKDGGGREGRHGWVLTPGPNAPGCVHEHLGSRYTCFFSPQRVKSAGICRLGDGRQVAQRVNSQCRNPIKRELTHPYTFEHAPVSITVTGMQSSLDCVFSDGDMTGHCYSIVTRLLQGSRCWQAGRLRSDHLWGPQAQILLSRDFAEVPLVPG